MLSQPHRLKTRAANFVVRRGRNISGSLLRIKWALAKGNISRATVVAGLVVDKRAVKRNLLKRRVREIIRPILQQLYPKVNLMVFINKTAANATFLDLKKELIFLLERARLL